ncbi:MAG: glycoside hydrolase [Chthoniobacterales bacterium]
MNQTILSLLLCAATLLAGGSGLAAGNDNMPKQRTVSADLRQVGGPLNTMFKRCVGAGRANEGLRADWQRQLAIVHRECGFEYIRMHGLFTDDMGVYREVNGKPEYNWQYIDELFDFLQSIGMKPFVELGFMPSALASGSQTIFWWRGNVTPPKDYAKWEAFIAAFVRHCTERYGADEVRSWYFEVWNEPNLDGFWMGNPGKKPYEEWVPGARAEYFKLYATTAHAVKSVDPAYRTGGPATAGCAWIPEFINFCKTNDVPVDFVSTHTYGTESGFLDETATAGTALSKNPDSIYGEVKRSRQEIKDSAFPKLEMHFTEWSSSYTPTDPMHDSYHSAAYILDKLRKCGDSPDSMSYWTFSDIFEEPGPRWEAFHGGFGLMNYQDIKKSAYFAYQFLNRLGPTELKCSDPSSWICTDNDGGVEALVWDFTYTFPAKNMINQVFYKRDLPSQPKGKVTLSVANVPKGKYTMETYKAGYRVNDPYATYRDMGAPAQLTKAQVAEIKSKNSGAPLETRTVEIGGDGKFEQQFDLRENDAVMITLKPQR